LVVATLEEAQRLLSHAVSVYFGYMSQGAAGGALAGCFEPTCQMLLFLYTPVPVLSERSRVKKLHSCNRLEKYEALV